MQAESMQTQCQTDLWTAIADRWRTENVPASSPATAEQIVEFESRYSLKLPPDLRHYFSTLNGTGDRMDLAGFMRFWPLNEIRTVEEYLPTDRSLDSRYRGSFVFADHRIDCWHYSIEIDDSGGGAVWSSNSDSRIAPSFVEFFEYYLRNPMGVVYSQPFNRD
jgi:SMI1 / KNR4 family (SUKH-1)